MRRPRIAVVGSANMDLVARVARTPAPGENCFGSEFRTVPGGKGANQAVAAARMDAAVSFIGRLGSDDFGRTLATGLETEGIDLTHLVPDKDAFSGTALIVVNAEGENSIVICPGANGRLTPDDVDAAAEALQHADMIVVQLEILLETVAHLVRRAKEWRVPVMLDAAPPCADPPKELFQVSILTPNRAEAAALLGRTPDVHAKAEAVANEMLARGAGTIVLKLGADGCLVADTSGCTRVPAVRVDVVDTTAAGDAFTGALAVSLAEGRPLVEAARIANCAGALAVTRFGAQPAMPKRSEVDELVASALRTDTRSG